MSGGSSENSSKNSSTTTQRVFGPQAKVLTEMYGKAPGIYEGVEDAIPGVQSGVMDWNRGIQDEAMPEWQQQLGGGQYNNLGFNAGEMLGGSLTNSMGAPTNEQQALDSAGPNNYVDSYRQSLMNDADVTTGRMLANTDARAAAAGMSGGSRHGIAQGIGMESINRDLQRNLSDIGYNDYTQNVNRQQQAGMHADQNLMQQQGTLAGLLGGQNSAQQQALYNSGNMQNLGLGEYNAAMMPVDAYGQMMNAIGAPTVLSTTTSKGKSSGSSGQGAF